MTVSSLYPPIAAATVLNVMLFALMWRGHQIQMRTGTAPWWLGFGMAVYAGLGALLVYLRRDQSIAGSLDVFGASMIGEGMGALITYGLLNGFVFTRGRPWSERAFPVGGSLFLAAVMIGAILTA